MTKDFDWRAFWTCPYHGACCCDCNPQMYSEDNKNNDSIDIIDLKNRIEAKIAAKEKYNE